MIGIAAGILCGMFGVGALLAAYVSRVTGDSDTFKANISAVFIADNTFRVILYSTLHLLTFQTVQMSACLLAFAMLGLFAGIQCSRILDEKKMKKLTAIVLVLSGISLIVKNL